MKRAHAPLRTSDIVTRCNVGNEIIWSNPVVFAICLVGCAILFVTLCFRVNLFEFAGHSHFVLVVSRISLVMYDFCSSLSPILIPP